MNADPMRVRPSAASWCRARPATPADNADLLALTAACPMRAVLDLCIQRDPDFFALNRLEGDRWTVGAVEAREGRLVGCIAAAERRTYVQGTPARTVYVSDLKVHPSFRGRGVADALVEHVRLWCGELGPDVLGLMTALAGNRAVERRVEGPRGTPRLAPIGTVRSFAVPLLLPPRAFRGDMLVQQAATDDFEEMAALWRTVAPERQFAAALDGEALARTATTAPGLGVASYWLARRPGSKRLAGFLALWDQESFKRTLVLRYSPAAAAFRAALNLLAKCTKAAPLPPACAVLRQLSAFHLCVPAGQPGTLRALLVTAMTSLRRAGYAFVSIGLDVRDPLASAMSGLWAFPTDIRVYVTTPRGAYAGLPLDDRPIHFETALV